jgi:hypothetical protein
MVMHVLDGRTTRTTDLSTKEHPMRKHLLSLGLAAGVLTGGAAGLALSVPGVSSAEPTTATATAGSPVAPAAPDRAAWVTAALQPLVDDGTITRAQADAVAAALQQAAPAGPMGSHGPRGELGLPGGPGLDAAAQAIGVTTDELSQALVGGQTIAGFAQSKGVDPQVVIDAMVAQAGQHLVDEVASGEHTQDEADRIAADLEQRITGMVNGELPAPPQRPALAANGG